MATESNHGGAREGAGRKPLPPGEAKIPRSFKIDPRIHAYFAESDNATKLVEDAIRRSKAFRDWDKETPESGAKKKSKAKPKKAKAKKA